MLLISKLCQRAELMSSHFLIDPCFHLVSANLTIGSFQIFVGNDSLLTGFSERMPLVQQISVKTSRVQTVRNLSLHLLKLPRNTSIFDQKSERPCCSQFNSPWQREGNPNTIQRHWQIAKLVSSLLVVSLQGSAANQANFQSYISVISLNLFCLSFCRDYGAPLKEVNR